MKKKITAVLFAFALGLAACGSGDDDAVATADAAEATSEAASSVDEESSDDSSENSGESSSGLSDEEQALSDAIVAGQMDQIDSVFTEEGLRCFSDKFVTSFGVERLNGYGITADNPDDSLVPQDYESQDLAVHSFEGCIDIGAVFESEIEGCSLDSMTEKDLFSALRHSFLTSFEEYDQSEGAGAQAALEAGLAVCAENLVAEE